MLPLLAIVEFAAVASSAKLTLSAPSLMIEALPAVEFSSKLRKPPLVIPAFQAVELPRKYMMLVLVILESPADEKVTASSPEKTKSPSLWIVALPAGEPSPKVTLPPLLVI